MAVTILDDPRDLGWSDDPAGHPGDAPAPASVPGGEGALLASLTQAIASNLDLNQVLQTVTDIATELSGAQFGAFFYNGRDEHGRHYQLHVLSGAGRDTFAALPVPRITSLFEPTFTGRATVRIDDLDAAGRSGGRPPGHLPVRSYLATPVHGSRTGDVIGALLFGHEAPGVFDARSERAVQLVAAQAGIAVENARLFAAEQAARRRAEEAVARLALVQALTDRLATAMTVGDSIRAVSDTLAGPLGLQRVALFQRDPDGGPDGAFVAVDGAGAQAEVARDGLVTLPAGIASPVADAARDGRPVSLANGELALRYPELAALGLAPVGASVCLPLTSTAGTPGVLALAWNDRMRVGRDELDMLVLAAKQVGSSLERARLFAAERDARHELAVRSLAATEVSRALQRSLLPRALPVVDRVHVAVRYQAAATDAEVGGDWYDMIATDGAVTFVVGDVMGHNINAATVMGQLRTGLHAYLTEGHRLDAALGRANRLLQDLDPMIIATCCVVRLDLASGQLQMVRAGHTHPLRRRPDGRVHELDVIGGPPLGVLASATWPVTSANLAPGERIMLYTDGLVERGDQDIDDGVRALRAVLAGCADSDAEATANAVLGSLGGMSDDDIALLICDYAPDRLERESMSFVVSQPEMVGRARAFTRDALAHWDMDSVADDATLVVSEMLSNVLRHTGSSATLELRRIGAAVRIGVTDVDSHQPRVLQRVADTATGGRGMKLVAALASAWGVEPCGTGKTVWARLGDGSPAAQRRTR